ncbi:MAG: hypothetical protein L6R42_008244, partial [Xanthoria sp. 1 TBL-2021]
AGDASQGGQGTGVDGELQQPISAFLPQSQNGSILVTSRTQAAALKLVEEKDMIAVEPMAESHALALFEKKLRPMSKGNRVAELAVALEFMPLAIVQAAAYISQRAPWYSLQRYLEDFQKSDRKKTRLLDYEGGHLRRDWAAENSIIVTWQISFEHIRHIRPSAADLLSLMSFFDRQGIPEALLRTRAGSGNGHGSQEERDEHDIEEKGEDDNDRVSECSDDEFEDDMQILRDYSFVSIDTNQTFEMHSLVQLATRKWLEANGQLEAWKQRYIQNLSAEFPTGEHENWTQCQVLFPHAKSAVTQRPSGDRSLRQWASLLHNAAWYTWRIGNITEAVDLSERAMKMTMKVLGPEHKGTLHSMGMAGLAYSLGGRWKEALELEVQVMETSKRVLGEEHPSTLTSINNLASIYWDQGRWTEAEELDVQVIEIRKRVQGEEHPDTLTSIGNLASTYRDQGRWTEAEELEVQVIVIRKRVQGEEYPSTLTSIGNLASTYWNQGRWTEAEELEVQVIEIRKRVQGEEHPNTLTSISNLAFTLKSQSRNEEAISMMNRCLKLQKQVLGPKHPDIETLLEVLYIWQDREDEL